jgi:hypothetical protein
VISRLVEVIRNALVMHIALNDLLLIHLLFCWLSADAQQDIKADPE